ncbi:MAG: hypothetical protein K5919_10950, partial [Clostridiales bacterium]|nr:hypothetical protein [Clostridiales bacterium]
MQPPQDYYPTNENGYPPPSQDPQWVQQGQQWTQPVQQNGPWAPQDQQWVQRPVPGQNVYGGYAPGQVPPPANIVTDIPTQQPMQQQMPLQGGLYPPTGGMGEPMEPGGMEETEQPLPDQSAEPVDQRIVYRPPSTGLPRQSARRSRLWPWILLLVVIGFAVFAVIRMTSPGQTAYGYVRFGSLSALYTGDAVLVRSETVITEESVSQIEYVAKEGTHV